MRSWSMGAEAQGQDCSATPIYRDGHPDSPEASRVSSSSPLKAFSSLWRTFTHYFWLYFENQVMFNSPLEASESLWRARGCCMQPTQPSLGGHHPANPTGPPDPPPGGSIRQTFSTPQALPQLRLCTPLSPEEKFLF